MVNVPAKIASQMGELAAGLAPNLLLLPCGTILVA
jgi:hypothetical protein